LVGSGIAGAAMSSNANGFLYQIFTPSSMDVQHRLIEFQHLFRTHRDIKLDGKEKQL
jgi:hypothetical protein